MILKDTFINARRAASELNLLSEEVINNVLLAVADQAEEDCDFILQENKRDLDAMEESNPKYDRLMLTQKRIADIASDIRKVASLPSPLGRTLWEDVRPNGMKISKVSVPFGVIGIIYEARPNVSFDVFSLCFKAGSACILKGGKEAQYSSIIPRTARATVWYSIYRGVICGAPGVPIPKVFPGQGAWPIVWRICCSRPRPAG